ncbi:MAG: hypothetical protein JJT75_06555 [Opitutales bacterium]|nr:hypothetical protein [Opitutales bacterium]MCH8540782.1 hypothetical protein [Opitutales bacterium]
MNRISTLLLSFSLLHLPIALHGDDVTLGGKTPLLVHLEADSNSNILATLSPAEDVWTIKTGIPLDDDLRNTGWRAIEFTHPILAWALSENLTKDLELRPETPIFAEPEASVENMLTVLEDPEEASVLREENSWVRVRVTTSLIGFAQRDEWVSAPEPELPLTEPEEEPTPQEEELPLEEMSDVSSPEASPSSPPTTTRPQRTLETADGKTVKGTMRFYEGFLGQNGGFFRRHPEYPFSLTNERGRRLADLDTSNLLLTTRLENHVGREIAVQGILIDDERKVPVLVLETLHLP